MGNVIVNRSGKYAHLHRTHALHGVITSVEWLVDINSADIFCSQHMALLPEEVQSQLQDCIKVPAVATRTVELII